MVGVHGKRHAFTDGMSRRDFGDVTPAVEPFGSIAPAGEPPLVWTPEHVAARMIEAFETLLETSGSVGPRRHANGWPAMLQEFSDLVDEEAMKHAREAFARSRRRPSQAQISKMDEALLWPLRYGRDIPLACDAVLIWSLCKAARISIAGTLRRRVALAKRIAGNMQRAEVERCQAAKRRETGERHLGIRDRSAKGYTEGRRRLINQAAARHADVTRKFTPVTVTPHDATPEKVLSRTTLDRHLPHGLRTLSNRLSEAGVIVR